MNFKTFFLLFVSCFAVVFCNVTSAYTRSKKAHVDENSGMVISRLSHFLASKTVGPFDYLETSGLKVLLCQFYDGDDKRIIETSNLDTCLVSKFNHDLQFEKNGRLEVLFRSGLARSWAVIQWEHLKVRRLVSGKQGWRRTLQKWTLPKLNRFYQQSLNHKINISFSKPLNIELSEAYDPLYVNSVPINPISMDQISIQAQLRKNKKETIAYVEFFGSTSNPILFLRTTFTVSKILSDSIGNTVPEKFRDFLLRKNWAPNFIKMPGVQFTKVLCVSPEGESSCRSDNFEFLKEFKSEE